MISYSKKLKNMINLIDGGHFFHRAVFSISAKYAHWDANMLYDKFTEILNEILAVSETSKNVLALEFGSWRKALTTAYKSSRKADNKIDWSVVKDAQKQFTSTIRNFGFNVFFGKDLEADDIIYKTVDKYQNTDNIVIFSSDRDLTQLLYNKADKSCIQIDLINRVIFVENATQPNYEISSFIAKTAKLFRLSITHVDTNNTIIEKICCGDDSDDIPSIYTYQKETKAGVRNYKFTAKKLESAIAKQATPKITKFGHYLFTDYEYKQSLLNAVLKILQDTEASKDANFYKLLETYDLNTRLVWLNDSSYDATLLQVLETSVKDNLNDFDYGLFQTHKIEVIQTANGFNSSYWTKYLNSDFI